jgi:hypothetical protein
LQYTVEARELTNQSNQGQVLGAGARSIIVEATNAGDAIAQYVRQNASQLVSLTTPAVGRESIATVKKDGAVFLVRVYEV